MTAEDLEAKLARTMATAHEREKEIKRLKRALANAETERARLETELARFTAVKPGDLRVPKWLARKPSKKAHHATPILMLSDLHLDEVVDLRVMHGMNEYNRAIAERRLQRVVDFTVEYCKRYTGDLRFDGIVVTLLGDIITGTIHEELAETNEATPPETLVHWVPILASALVYLADFFGHVHVPCVDGNHDRTGKKITAKRRAESSWAWVLYNWLADTLKDDDRITFAISPSSDQIVPVYNTNFLLVHGDGFRGGGGVGGIYPPLLKYLYRQHQMWAAFDQHWDFCLMGHWHSLMWGQDFIVNGSLKGYDEYARRNGFGFEKARQALFLVTPERGITTQTAVYADPS